ncbi:MAG: hypothetical protein KDB01_09310, partial [Planctomycetaceae bacterium]|nr:hypothetical protein [Planctomycetaceae bacterium]
VATRRQGRTMCYRDQTSKATRCREKQGIPFGTLRLSAIECAVRCFRLSLLRNSNVHARTVLGLVSEANVCRCFANGSRWRIWNKEHTYAGPATGDCHSPRCNSGRRTWKGAQAILNRQLKLKRLVVALARSSDDN